MLKHLAITSLLAFVVTPAFASSGDAWEEFAAEVEAGCVAATSEILTNATVVVDPFGSESYGLAVVTGEVAPDTLKSIICVFDKQTKAIEIGGELDIPPANP